MTAVAVVREVEASLAAGDFGDGALAAVTADAYYRGLGRLCADTAGVARELLSASAVPQLEALRRGGLDSALRDLLAERSDAGRQAIRDYARLIEGARGDASLSADADEAASHPAPYVLRAVAGHAVGEQLVGRWNSQTVRDGENLVISAVQPTAQLVASVHEATALVTVALPRIGPDTLRHVAGLVLCTGYISSGHFAQTPVLIYVNVSMLTDLFDAAESILHECLHQKLLNIGIARTIFRSGYNDLASETVPIPWNGDKPGLRMFSADRAISAYHVYVHQSLLYAAILAGGVPSPPGVKVSATAAADRLILAWARAHEFKCGFEESAPRSELGQDGLKLLAWLDDAADRLGTIALSDGSALAAHSGHFLPDSPIASRA